LNYEYVNASRVAFMPPFLNFYGLLGYDREMVNYGQTSVFFDDLELGHEGYETTLRVASDALLTIHLEQDAKNVHVTLVQHEKEGG
jgi:hypothetical protein